MSYLLDTCVISELASKRADPNVVRWVDSVDPESIYLSTVTVGEIRKGIEKVRDPKRKETLDAWLHDELLIRFFAGFARSSDASLQEAGRIAIADIQVERTQKSSASELEREGFRHLIEGNHEEAIANFTAAEKAYPTYHNVSEISRLLRKEQEDLSDRETRQRVLDTIVKDYSWGMEPDVKARLRDEARGGQ